MPDFSSNPLAAYVLLVLLFAVTAIAAYAILLAALKRRFGDLNFASRATYRGAARMMLAPWRYGLRRHHSGALCWFDRACPCCSGNQAAVRVLLTSWRVQLLFQSLFIGAAVFSLAGPVPAAAGILIGFLANVGRNAMRNSRRAGMPGFFRSFGGFALNAIGWYGIGARR